MKYSLCTCIFALVAFPTFLIAQEFAGSGGFSKDALGAQIAKCWNTGALSSDALTVTVEVYVAMKPDGKPEAGSIKMVRYSGGSETAAKQAYEAARRAIIRCGARGFDLPREKYDHWREIEMVFNPTNMRVK